MQNMYVDTGKLPIWPVFQAMNVSYAEAVVRLQMALNVEEQKTLLDLQYKMFFGNSITGEQRMIVQRGAEDSTEASAMPWDIAISILALIRLKDYTATYAKGGVVSLYFTFPGGDDRKSDMDRVLLLFAERSEFSMFDLSDDIKEDGYGEEEESSEEEAQQGVDPAKWN